MKRALSLTALLFVTVFTMSFVMQGDWVLVEAKHCKIYFPQKPTTKTQTVSMPAGDMQLNIYMYKVPDSVHDDNLEYDLIVTEYPDSSVSSNNKKNWLDDFFDGTIKGFVNKTHGKLLSTSVIEYEGYPGRAFKVEIKDGVSVMNVHFYLVKNEMFMLITITETKNDANKSIDKFMGSFGLVK